MSALARTTEINCDTRAANEDCINGGSRTRTKYTYDGFNASSVSGNQILNGDGIDEVYTAGASSSLLTDGIGSTLAITDSAGNISGSYTYGPYGNTSHTGSATAPNQYSGRENDGDTNLYYYRARYYSPTLNRFISQDPIGLGGGMNVYGYVAADPITYRDPSGHELIAGAVGSAVGAGFGLLTGYLSGDRGEALLIDAAAGGLTGGLAGLTNGLSLLEGIGTRALISTGVEGYRQLANDVVTDCVKDTNFAALGLAGAGSIVGDGIAIPFSTGLGEAFGALNHTVSLESETITAGLGGSIAGVVSLPAAIAEYIRAHP